MYLFIEKRMRGGLSYITEKISKAYNKYMKSYDNKEPSKHIIYLNANNLYGCSASQYLTNIRLKQVNQRESDKVLLNQIEYNSIEENSSGGYILEADFECLDKLHALHNYQLTTEYVH